MSDFERYINTVFKPNDIVELRLLGSRSQPRKPIQWWYLARDMAAHESDLQDLNSQGYNIYAGPNPRKAMKQSGNDNVLLARTLFCDFDDIEPMDGCCPWNEVSERIHRADLPAPDLVISSGHGIHAYWLLEGALLDLEHWSRLQKGLIEILRSDPCIHNSERIMRVPGFQNVKVPDTPMDCFIIL
jgi:hypothetical protein